MKQHIIAITLLASTVIACAHEGSLMTATDAHDECLILGELSLESPVSGSVEAADPEHGYLLPMVAGQEVELELSSTVQGQVGLLGPARYDASGAPKFDYSVLSASTVDIDGAAWASVRFRVRHEGQYLVTWATADGAAADYTLHARCVQGCDSDEPGPAAPDATGAPATASEEAAETTGGKAVPLSPSHLLATPAFYDNTVVTVLGFVAPGATACTKMACDVDTQCCNSCAAFQRVYTTVGATDDGVLLTRGGARAVCDGSECELERCQLENGAAAVTGLFRADGDFGPTLDVHQIQQ